MQSDAEQIDSWWRGQDSTRAPRNDLAAFPCGTELDITTVHSTLSGAQLAPLDGRFPSIFQSLQQAGLTSSFTKYLVYYERPHRTRTTSVARAGARIRPAAWATPSSSTLVGAGIPRLRHGSRAATEFLQPDGKRSRPARRTRAPRHTSGHHVRHRRRTFMVPGSSGTAASRRKLLDPGRDD
jgi:hypothetical protein